MRIRTPLSLTALFAALALPLSAMASGWLGITVDMPKGALVGEIIKDSPADKAGLHKNDIIVKINGEEVANVRQFVQAVSKLPAGSEVKLTVERKGAPVELTATLEDSADHPTLGRSEGGQGGQGGQGGGPGMGGPGGPGGGPGMGGPGGPGGGPGMGGPGGMGGGPGMGMPGGMSQGMTPSGNKGWFGIAMEAADHGVKVRDVAPGSPAEKAGLKKGDVITTVNSKAVTSTRELVRVMDNTLPGDRMEVSFQRDGAANTTQVDLVAQPQQEN